MTANDVITFWFETLTPEQWWVKDNELDQRIRERFLATHQQANQGELYDWRYTAKGRLAEIIVLDQFSRNIFRDQPAAFASDPLALMLAQEAISQNQHHKLSAIERSFLYMPFMHSESLKIHNVALKLFQGNGIESGIDFEVQHRNIIVQFGRYPHRNALLNRQSSQAELDFLSQPNSSF